MDNLDKVENTTMTYVSEKVQNMHALKELDFLQSKSMKWMLKANIKEVNDTTRNDFRTQISAVVKMQKDAELLSAVPEWTFMPLDDNARRNRKIVKPTWNYHWMISETDKHISNVIQSATTNGTGIIREDIRHIYKTTKVPKYVSVKNEDGTVEKDSDGNEMLTIEYEEQTRLEKSGVFCERIPFQNFFINGTDMDNATGAAVVNYYDKTEYLSEKSFDPQYSRLDEVKASVKGFYIVPNTVGDSFDETTTENTVAEIEYWNLGTDEYRVEANGIEVRNTPIPYVHKMLPFSLYLDNKADNRIFGIGEFELLEQEERTKNELRTMLMKGVKFSVGLVAIDRNADITDEVVAGIGETLETDDMNAIKQITFTIPIGDISAIESRIDNDIISKSGIDFKSQQLSPGETAKKTDSKNKSSKKRINKNIKDNAYGFYRRLAELRMSNIQFLHSANTQDIPIEGGTINANGTFTKEEGGGFGNAIIGKDRTEGKFRILPIVETMLGNSKERQLEKVLRFAEIAGNIKGEDGQNVIKGNQLAQKLTEEFGFDFEALTEQSTSSKSATDIMKDLKKGVAGTKGTVEDDTFVPPEQRRQQDQVKSVSGIAALPPE